MAKPPADYVPIPGDPLTPDLGFLFQEGSGTITYDKAIALTGGLTTGAVFGGLGITISGTGTMDSAYPDDTPYLGAITLVWIGKYTSAGNNNMMSKTPSNGGTVCPFDFYISGGGVPTLVRSNAGPHIWTMSSGTITINTRTIVSVVAPSTIQTAPTFYVNGSSVSATDGGGGGTGAPTGAQANIRVGRRPDGGTQLIGEVEAVFFYGHALNGTEQSALNSDPYQWLQAPGAGGLAGPIGAGLIAR